MSSSVGKIIITTILMIIGLVIFALFYTGSIDEVLGVIIGLLLAGVSSRVLALFSIANEDKNKIGVTDYSKLYDNKYERSICIDGTQKFWYEPILTQSPKKLLLHDCQDQFFEPDSLILCNYTDIFLAHKGSALINPTMIRLDNYSKQDDTISLSTSRTMFYNDLVTNRAMDYEFATGLTIRNIYEHGPELTPLHRSKLSNHIGVNAIIFFCDNMLLPERTRRATMSKGFITSTLAFGLQEQMLTAIHGPNNKMLYPQDILENIVIMELAQRYYTCNDNDILSPFLAVKKLVERGIIKVHFLGFGRLLETGGKPQFYYAVSISKEAGEALNLLEHPGYRHLDADKKVLIIKSLKIDRTRERSIVLNVQGTKKPLRKNAETSFFANLWHLLNQPKLEGIPTWIYSEDSFAK